MNLVIMQPYFMAYCGYWQLLNAADKFVVYDDVNYIKQGWINRNRLLVNNKPCFITLPLTDASPFKKINNIELVNANWREKILKTIKNTYAKSRYFHEVYPTLESIVIYSSNNLADYVTNSIVEMAKLLEIDTQIVRSSSVYMNDALSAQERVLDICKKESASVYINAAGGRALYSFEDFSKAGIELKFISCAVVEYKQSGDEFTPYLSIIDQLMSMGGEAVKSSLDNYSLERS
ncbi:WbqC family protein [Pseudomonas paraveronii]|uniref:WbqC family protein n=1 Tax=Pseudomonas paraveronii TaxID=3040598 RepID=UPI002AB20D2F|nr:WbqC family protein [Pseudomonas sp. FLM 11]